jgi:hypothetical protein
LFVRFVSQEAADGKKLKRAFRKLCLRYHPDIAREEGAVEKFQELQEAYRVLADDGEGALDVPLPEDLEWSAHDWRWAMRYNRGNAGDDDETAGGSDRPLDDLLGATRKVEEAERKARLEAQLSAMASAPTRRKRRVVKPIGADKPKPEAASSFAAATRPPSEDEGDCPSDGCSTDFEADEALRSASEDEDEVSKQARHAREARRTRGYQSDRHSTESAHERLNSQLAGLHRKKVIRARAFGYSAEETAARTSAARRSGDEHEVRDETNAARFYGGVGLQLEESTPERFLRLAKLAREWREQRSMSDAIFSADIAKPSAKELLQAAVEGVSLGACT